MPGTLCRSTAWGFLVGIVLAVCMLFALNVLFMQRLVSWALPVIKDVRILPGASVHSDGILSFYLGAHKEREGFPEYYAFFAVNDLGQGTSLDVYRADPRSCVETPHDGRMVVHQIGTTWVQHYCTRIPLHLPPDSGFKVIGEAAHKAWPWLALVTHTLPEFTPRYNPVPYHNPFGGPPGLAGGPR